MGLGNLWENFYPTISDSHILSLVTYKSLKRSCMNTLGLRLPESWVCELLTNRHHHSGKCSHRVFPPDCNIHTHILPQSHIRGRYPSRAVYELILSLNHATYHQLGYGLASHLKLIKRKTLSIPNRMIMQKQLN